MADRIVLEINLTPEEHQQIEHVARERGYETPADYVRALIGSDVETHDQAYFWTDEWQAAERKVDEEIAAGQYQDFETLDEFLDDLMSDDE